MSFSDVTMEQGGYFVCESTPLIFTCNTLTRTGNSGTGAADFNILGRAGAPRPPPRRPAPPPGRRRVGGECSSACIARRSRPGNPGSGNPGAGSPAARLREPGHDHDPEGADPQPAHHLLAIRTGGTGGNGGPSAPVSKAATAATARPAAVPGTARATAAPAGGGTAGAAGHGGMTSTQASGGVIRVHPGADVVKVEFHHRLRLRPALPARRCRAGRRAPEAAAAGRAKITAAAAAAAPDVGASGAQSQAGTVTGKAAQIAVMPV